MVKVILAHKKSSKEKGSLEVQERWWSPIIIRALMRYASMPIDLAQKEKRPYFSVRPFKKGGDILSHK